MEYRNKILNLLHQQPSLSFILINFYQNITISILLILFAIVPITTLVYTKISFITQTGIKSYLRSTIEDYRLTRLALLNMHLKIELKTK